MDDLIIKTSEQLSVPESSYVYNGDNYNDLFEMFIWLFNKKYEELESCVIKRNLKKKIIYSIIRRDDYTDLFELFLLRGLNTDMYIGIHPIIFKASAGNLKLLLEYGANPNVRLKYGLDALHYFLRKDDNENKIKLLIRAGADLNYSFNKKTSRELIIEKYGEDFLKSVCYSPLFMYDISNDFLLFHRLVHREQEKLIRERHNTSSIIVYAFNYKIPLELYGYDKVDVLRQHKYEVFEFLSKNVVYVFTSFAIKNRLFTLSEK